MHDDTPEDFLAAAITALRGAQFAQHLNAWLSTIAQQDNTTILAYSQDQAPKVLMAHSSTPEVHKNIENTYLTGAYLLDPFYELHRRGKPAGLYRIWDIAPDKFFRHQYFTEYYRSTKLVDEVGFVAWVSATVSVHVCLGRDTQSGKKFSSRDLSELKKIEPIVRACICAHWADLKISSRVHKHEENVTQRMARLLAEHHNIKLTNRQAEVALLVLQGHSSSSIGLFLGIATQTVKVFRKQLYKKCGISSQAELFRLLLPILSFKI